MGYVWQRLVVVLGLLWLLAAPSLVWGAAPELQIFPDLVEIGAFFRGHRLAVEAKIPPGTEAVIEIVGQAADEHLMRKGRRGGLWMNVGEIDFHRAPSLYMVMSTDAKLLDAAAAQFPWGFAALKRQVTLSGMVTEQEKDDFFKQFLNLKGNEGLYATRTEPIKKTRAVDEMIPVKGEFWLPTNVKTGSYEVCVSVVQDGRVIAKKCREVRVTLVGFPALLSALAYEHATTYGILAVVIAIVTGFAIGFLFKGGGGH
jgi:hypothetical protein